MCCVKFREVKCDYSDSKDNIDFNIGNEDGCGDGGIYNCEKELNDCGYDCCIDVKSIVIGCLVCFKYL